MRTIAFFNNKGGVGKTSMVYHLAWMYAEMNHKVLAVDLDPQSNLTGAFLDEDVVDMLWERAAEPQTMLSAVQRLMDSLGDIVIPKPKSITKDLTLLPGDLGLSRFEDRLGEAWSKCLDDNPANSGDGFRVMTAFYRIMRTVADQHGCDTVLVDVGPNVGALNRAALVAADYLVIPLGADLFSIKGLTNIGPILRQWRDGWAKRKAEAIPTDMAIPSGSMEPIGYVLLNPSVRENRPVKAYERWANRIPETYACSVLGQKYVPAAEDPNRLAMIKHFKSLMPMAQDARKPMFLLKAADGAIGGHASAVQECYRQFKDLAERILLRTTGNP